MIMSRHNEKNIQNECKDQIWATKVPKNIVLYESINRFKQNGHKNLKINIVYYERVNKSAFLSHVFINKTIILLIKYRDKLNHSKNESKSGCKIGCKIFKKNIVYYIEIKKYHINKFL
jgi:hypothetical protein